MRGRRPRGIVVLLAVLLALAAPAAQGVDEGWLVGRWELTHDPDGSQKDWLEFRADGGATSVTPSGQRFAGRYALTDSAVQINYKVGDRSIIITLVYGPDRKQLYARSARTGNTAVYEKRP